MDKIISNAVFTLLVFFAMEGVAWFTHKCFGLLWVPLKYVKNK